MQSVGVKGRPSYPAQAKMSALDRPNSPQGPA